MSNWRANARDAWSKAWSKDNLGSTVGTGVSGLTGIASTFGETARLKEGKINELDNQIDDINNTQFGYGDYDSLQSAFINPQISDFSSYDLRQSDGERAISTLKGIGSGAMAGAQIGGPIGAVVGGAAGLFSGLAGSFFGNRKAKREAERLNEEAEEARDRYLANFSNNAEQISQNKFNTAALNLAAFGGMLKNNNIDNFTKSKVRLAAFGGNMFSPLGREDGFTNGVVKVNEGGSHETNPYDGVLMGVDPAGTPNLVEEGEVLFNDYVFSNRLYPTGGQLESVRLPKRYEGKSYSEIAWDLQKESQLNPLDKISRNTLIDSMAKLTTLQEQSRERDQEYQAFDNLEQVFADGGDIHIKKSKVGTFTAAAKKRGMGVQEFASTVLANKDKYSPAMVRKAQFAHNAAGWKHAFGGDLNNDVNTKYKEDTDSLELAKSARIFSDILGNGKTLTENISAIPPYYKFGNGRKLFDEAYQSKLGAPHSWYLENENRVKQKLIEQADRIESNQKIHAFGGNLYAGGSILDGLKRFDTQSAKEQMERNITRAFGRDGFQGFGGGEFSGAGASGSFAYDPEGVTMFDYVRNTPIPIETSFSDAYAQARRDGLKTFMFNGKEYTTDYNPNAKLGQREYETTLANLRQVLDENRKEIPDSTRIEPWVGQIPGEYKRTKAFGGNIDNALAGNGDIQNDKTQIDNTRVSLIAPSFTPMWEAPSKKALFNSGLFLDDNGVYYYGPYLETRYISNDSAKNRVEEDMRRFMRYREDDVLNGKQIYESKSRRSYPKSYTSKPVFAFGGKVGNIFAGAGKYPNFLGIKQPKFNTPQIAGYLPEAGVIDWSNPFAANQAILDANANRPEAPVDLFPNGSVPTTTGSSNGNTNRTAFRTNNLAQAFRAVPVVGSAINAIGDAVGWRNREDYTWSDRIGNAARTIRNVSSTPIGGYMSYNPYDVDYEMNRLQNVGLGTQRALLDTVGGNSLAARNAMLALNNNITGQMGEARRRGAEYNDNLRRTIQQFNTGIDQFNAGQSLNSQIYNQRADEERVNDIIRQAMLADSIQSATSQARSTEETAALNNAGQWGNDMMYNDMARYYLEHIAPNNDATRDASWILGRRYGAKGGKIKKSNIKEFKKK